MTVDYEVIIVGAGPSGSTLARKLAADGFSTLLLDKEKHPRFKPCGGLVSTRALRRLGLDVGKVTKETYYEGRIFRPKGDFVDLSSRSPLAIGVSRAEFDHLLVEKAIDQGADFVENHMVDNLSFSPEKVTVVTSRGLNVTGNIVVGADGVNSTVARMAGIRQRWESNEVAGGLVTEIQLGNELVRNLFPANLLEFHFGISRTGYGWIFPKGDILNVGVGTLLSEQKGIKRLFDSFVLNDSRLRKLAISDCRYHLLPVGGFAKHLCADRALLIGDAAGFADPLSGEGIFYAIESAEIAFRAITMASEMSEFSEETLSLYSRDCEDTILSELRRAYSFARKVHYHPNFMLGLFIADSQLRRNLVEVLTGDSSYARFTRCVYRRLPVSLMKCIRL